MPARTAAGTTVLFNGWIDNLEELSAALPVPPNAGEAAVYAAAVERWGDGADARVHGSYCSIVEVPDRRIRLARSPWTAPPLVYASDRDRAVIASVPRVLFAAGIQPRLNQRRVADSLWFGSRMPEDGWYHGTRRVPHGSIVHLSPGHSMTLRWYQPEDIARVRLESDAAYVEAAGALLAQAAGLALRRARFPGIALSGGLDSALVADELLRQLPPGRGLPSFTAVPHPHWDGRVAAGMYGNERSLVEDFARDHPRLVPTFLERPLGNFDDGARALYAATGMAPRNVTNVAFHHAIWAAAGQAGCDWLFDAESGNDGLSNDGRWSYVEFLRSGRWRQLYRVMAARAGDSRPVWRRIASLSVLRSLPRGLREAVRGVAHPELRNRRRLMSLLRPEAAQSLALEPTGSNGRLSLGEYPATRRETIRYAYDQSDFEGAEVWQGFEQVYGVRRRDVCAYRPLLEFCLGIPTDQLVRDGEDRWLARRLAKGRLPEAQRINRRYGRHNADWHVRLGSRRGELKAEAERLRNDPEVDALIDIDRLVALLDAWPARTPLDLAEALPREIGITRALTSARFIQYVSGRNDI